MSSLSFDVDAWLQFADTGRPPIRHVVELQWFRSHPLELRLVFGPREPQWRVGRDLLDAGLDAPAGGHDVTALPDPWDKTRVLIVLASPTGRVEVSVDAVDLDAFLQATYHRVPAGADCLTAADLDGLLRGAGDGSLW